MDGVAINFKVVVRVCPLTKKTQKMLRSLCNDIFMQKKTEMHLECKI